MLGTNPCNVFVLDPSNGTTKLAFSLAVEGASPPRPDMGFFEESLARAGASIEREHVAVDAGLVGGPLAAPRTCR